MPRTDELFKQLLAAYPNDALALLCPRIVSAWGAPCAAELLATEALPAMLQRHGRHMDCAIRFRWTDGRQAAVLLVEHWSDATRVDLARVLRYVGELAARLPGLPILPILLISDRRSLQVSSRLVLGIPGWEAVTLDAEVVRLAHPPQPPRTRFAVVMSALAGDSDRISAAIRLLRQLADAPGPIEDLHWLLHLIQNLLGLPAKERKSLLDRLYKDPSMLDIIGIIEQRGAAKGKAEGKAEGISASLRRRIAHGTLTVDGAREEVRDLQQDGVLSAAEAEDVLARLG